jgi:hypothetical protein
MVPTSTLGRLVASLAAYIGILCIALPVTIVGTNFTTEYEQMYGPQNRRAADGPKPHLQIVPLEGEDPNQPEPEPEPEPEPPATGGGGVNADADAADVDVEGKPPGPEAAVAAAGAGPGAEAEARARARAARSAKLRRLREELARLESVVGTLKAQVIDVLNEDMGASEEKGEGGGWPSGQP